MYTTPIIAEETSYRRYIRSIQVNLEIRSNDCLETYYHYDTICEMDLDLAKEAEMGMVKTFFQTEASIL